MATVITARRDAVTGGIAALLTDRVKIHEIAVSLLRRGAVGNVTVFAGTPQASGASAIQSGFGITHEESK